MSLNRGGRQIGGHFTLFSAPSEGFTDQRRFCFPQRCTPCQYFSFESSAHSYARTWLSVITYVWTGSNPPLFFLVSPVWRCECRHLLPLTSPCRCTPRCERRRTRNAFVPTQKTKPPQSDAHTLYRPPSVPCANASVHSARIVPCYGGRS